MATRSPSPNPSRPTTHKPRTPDSSHGLRKSKEMSQRTSLSKSSTPSSPSIRASFEQKENMKLRSPAFSSLKGSKNFMTPTISAASKAITASPRKKILQEKNEVVNSVSDSLEFTAKEAGGSVGIEEIGSKLEMVFGSQELSGGFEVKKGDSKFKNHRNVVVPSVSPLSIISSLDADPSLPPYDPKTNYLSPRPQFLHYRPNPRIEHYLNQEEEVLDVGDGRRLEDSFSWDSSEDGATVLAEEKDLAEESSPMEVESLTEILVSELEFKSPSETLVSEPEFKSPSETLVSQPEFKSEPLKRWPLRRSKLVPFLLLLVMACFYAPLVDSPIISSSMLKEQSFLKFYTPSYGVFKDLHLRDYLAVANLNTRDLTSRFKRLSTDSIAYFSSLTSPLKDDVRLYPLVNMTNSAVDETAGLGLTYKHETETEQAIKENEVEELSLLGPESELSAVVKKDAECNAEKMEVGSFDENTEKEATKTEAEKINLVGSESELSAVADGAQYNAEKTEIGIFDENTEMEMEDTKIKAEKIEMVVSEDVKEDDVGAQRIEMEVYEDVTDVGTVGYELEKEIIGENGRNELESEASHPSYGSPHVEEVVENTEMEYIQSPQHIVAEDETIGGKYGSSDVNSIDHAQSDSYVDNQSELSQGYQILHGLEMLKSMNNGTMLGVSVALLVLAATFVFLYMKQKQVCAVKKETQKNKKFVGSVSGSSESHIPAKGSPNQNYQGNEGMIGDSSSSEVSSSWKNTSSSGGHQIKRDKEEQNLSYERRLRRDSGASSSISYGSFTTYEKVSAKKGGRDEEVVTPVRRSNRIRNLVTSP